MASFNTEEENGKEKETNPSKNIGIMKLNDHKAGMEGLDTEKINKIIDSASKGSKFYLHKQKSQERINFKISELKLSFSKLNEDQRKTAKAKMDQMAMKLEQTRDLTRCIVHVDMDAFYAAVEMRDKPELRDAPMAVGSNSMLSTSNYHARRYGVRAAMPGFIAKKLCPELVIVPTNFPKYTEVSRQVQQIFADYDPEFSAASLDEAYLDLTDFLKARQEAGQHITPAEAVQEMRKRIHKKTQLTASAGIAPNGMLAKVCSDKNKPNGQFELESSREAVAEFIEKLPIRKISGIGNVTEQMLGALDITTCKNLWEKRDLLYLLFSESSYDYFIRVALGLGSDGGGGSERERKSVSCETTFRSTSDKEELLEIVSQLSQDLAVDLQRHKVVGKAVTLKYKTEGFDVKTRITQLHANTCDASVIEKAAQKILSSEIEASKPGSLILRLLGVRMSMLSPSDGSSNKKQRTLSELLECPPKKRKVEENPSEVPEEASGADEGVFTCPVCYAWRTRDGDVDLNRHVDECLNQQVIGSSSMNTNSVTSAKQKNQTKLDQFIIRKK